MLQVLSTARMRGREGGEGGGGKVTLWLRLHTAESFVMGQSSAN